MYQTEPPVPHVTCSSGALAAERRLHRLLLSAPLRPPLFQPQQAELHPVDVSLSVPGSSSNSRSNGFYCCSCIRAQDQGMDISELELVQIITIVLVMTLIVVVIICLLSHYWLPALAFFTRVSHTQTDQATQLVIHSHLHRPPFTQPQRQQHLYRLQPVYPYLRQEIINLPPIICLSDGEERLPYKGPCRLELRDPEQQLELRRATVSAPPNRSVFDIDPTDVYSQRKTTQASCLDTGTRTVCDTENSPPPSYSEVMVIEDYSASTARFGERCNNVAPTENSSECDSLHTVPNNDISDPDSTTCTNLTS